MSDLTGGVPHALGSRSGKELALAVAHKPTPIPQECPCYCCYYHHHHYHLLSLFKTPLKLHMDEAPWCFKWDMDCNFCENGLQDNTALGFFYKESARGYNQQSNTVVRVFEVFFNSFCHCEVLSKVIYFFLRNVDNIECPRKVWRL